MHPKATVRVANSMNALERVLTSIETGRRESPDWIRIQGRCRLDAVATDERELLLRRLHANVRRGFTAPGGLGASAAERLALWRSIARNGFHDFGSQGFTKCYGSPFVEDYDYVGAYLEHGLGGIDPYRVYSAILGSHDYTVEDFLLTPTCEKIDTVIEPMAGTSEFSHCSHFRHPELRYILFDLDEAARDAVLARPWLDGADREYRIGNVLDPRIWRGVRSGSRGRSLAYIGKQSHNLFDARQLYELLALGTAHADSLVLETPEPSLVQDLAPVDDLTRPEMADAGFHAALVEDEQTAPNPFTNRLGFRMQVWDEHETRVLFEYPRWRAWQPPTLVALAELLGLEVLYLDEAVGDFVPVDACRIARQPDAWAEAHDGVGFMLFRRRP